ncbi:MAG TPA: hypothetical protein VHB45_12920 [Alloacidobacterium sp.]|nr:hypothetical protein [Alloacidobacterium sp.]
MSEVTICNLALSHLGDTATVASINPPEASVQAQLCSKFYPVARNALLEMNAWGFATRRAALAQLAAPVNACPQPWKYTYAMPNAVLNVLAILPKDAPDDYEAWFGPSGKEHYPPYPQGYVPVPGPGIYMPQPFTIEADVNGKQIVLTNVCDAVMRYTTIVEDTTKFSPLFVVSLSWLLASMLAGPLLKGDAGAQEATRCVEMLDLFRSQAQQSDANQRKTQVEPAVSWMRGR